MLISNVDDHLRHHGFLWLGRAGWSLSPAYDLNPVPTDLKARVLTTNIDLDEGTCSLDLLEAACEFFVLTLAQARVVIKEVASVTETWRDTAKALGARRRDRPHGQCLRARRLEAGTSPVTRCCLQRLDSLAVSAMTGAIVDLSVAGTE